MSIAEPYTGAAVDHGRIIAGILGCSEPIGTFILNDPHGAVVIQNQLKPSRMTWKMNVLDHGVLNGGSVVRLVWLTYAVSRRFARGS